MAKMCFFGGSIRLFINFPLWQEGNVQLFLCLKEKVAKRSKQACCLTCFAAHQLCRSVFSVPKIAVPQNSTSAVCKAKRLGFVGSRTNGFDLMGGFFWEPHHANHDPPSRMDSDVSRFVGSAVCMGADGVKSNMVYKLCKDIVYTFGLQFECVGNPNGA